MFPKAECSDELLLGILNEDSGYASRLGMQHLDDCEHCQARIEELAANQRQWTLAREGLCSRGDRGPNIEAEIPESMQFIPKAEKSSDWTETVAKQLLQPPSHPEMMGRLGRYEIERLVGSGGMGVVFKAYDSELHRSVAIKMLAPHLSGSRSARERFAREARAAAAIVNDHVVPIHNVETEHATPYLVMQYIAGDSLQARLDRDGPLELCEILRVGMQVATGLAAAHAQGLIHRDVKPSNIMLDENVARALLTDFGLARTQDDACITRSGFHPGTPHYMSPEQVRGEELDGRSDLFSLGCVLYALCTGHPPYRADSGYAVMRRITDEQPRSIRQQNAMIPEWLERIVVRLLEKDRDSRFQSADELAQILKQCLAHVQKPTTESLPLAIVPKTSFFGRWRLRSLIVTGMASAFLFFAGVVIVLESNKGTITIQSEADNVPIRIMKSDRVVDEMVVSRSGKSVRLAAGEYMIEFEGDSQDLVVQGGNVSLVHGETKTLHICYRKVSGESQPTNRKLESNVAPSRGLASPESEATTMEKDSRVLSAISRLDAPATISVDEELGVVTVKGSRSDVERTLRIIEMIREISTNQPPLKFPNVETPTIESTTTEKDIRALAAISRLDAPVTITVDEEIGLVTLRGAEADVEKTNRMIEMIRKIAEAQPSTPIDGSKLSAAVPTVESDLAASVNEFNCNRRNWWALWSANSPLLTEDEFCASLWWQANHTKISSELRKHLLAIVVNRSLPTGWSIQLKDVQGEIDKDDENLPLRSNYIQIQLMQADQVAVIIRSQFVWTNHDAAEQTNSPLAAAIADFNKKQAGVQPPLTLSETLAAVATLWEKDPKKRPESSGLTEVATAKLKRLAEHLTMDGITIESALRDHEVGDSNFLTWKINLEVTSSDSFGGRESFQIRKRFLRADSLKLQSSLKPLRSALDALKMKADRELATEDQVLAAELELLDATIRLAETNYVKALPALLHQRENTLKRAFHLGKSKYEAGMIGIDLYAQTVAELHDAKFATRVLADGQTVPPAESLTDSEANTSSDNESILLIEEFCIKSGKLGDDHPQLLRLREKIAELGYGHEIDESSIQNRLFELNRERQKLLRNLGADHPSLRENAIRHDAVANLRSGSFPTLIKKLMETDPRNANLLPTEWRGEWLVESAIIGDGKPLEVAIGTKMSIFKSTMDWDWSELARESYVVTGVTVNGKQSLVDLHWRAAHPNMLATEGDVQFLVEYRDSRLWIVRMDQPETPVPETVDLIQPGHTRFVLKRLSK